jgi:serine/threonine-protein kinase
MTDVLDRFGNDFADRYRIEREVGRGGMAVVYLAEDLKHRRKIALKVLRPEVAAFLGSERFLREIEIAAQLTHPHILPLFDSGRVGGSAAGWFGGPAEASTAQPPDRSTAEFLYYTMPFVDGESLRDRLNREKQLPIEDALQITREVAEALGHAHEKGIIHRDIKPENILFQGGHALVADFGIARAVTEAAGERLTETGLAVGTPAYMTPEQAAGEREIDARSDMYSLAAVLYEMLAGEPPHTGPTAGAIVAKKLSAAVPRIALVRDTVPGFVEASIMKGLAKTPADRFPTAAHFIMSLDDSGREGRPAGTAKRPRRWGALAAAAMALTVLVVTVAVVVGNVMRAPAAARVGVAVLPLENLDPVSDTAGFTRGLHDELIGQLWKIAGLRVPSSNRVRQYAVDRPAEPEIAEALDVSYVLFGRIRWSGGTIRMAMELADARGEVVWTEQYQRDLSVENVFAIQAEIALRVARELSVVVAPGEVERVSTRLTDELDAYEHYLAARGAMWTGAPDDLLRAEESLLRSVQADSGFAAAWAALALTRLSLLGHGVVARPLSGAKQALDRAVALAPDLAHTRRALAAWYGLARGDLGRAAHEFERVLAEQPGNVDALWGKAQVLRDAGQITEALAVGHQVLEIEPSARTVFDIGFMHLLMGEYEEAEDYIDRAARLAPDWAYPQLGPIYIALLRDGDLATARAALDRMRRQVPRWKVLYEFSKTSLPQHYPFRRILLPELSAELNDTATVDTLRGTCTPCLWLLRADAASADGRGAAATAYHDSILAWHDTLITRADEFGPLGWHLWASVGMSRAHVGDRAGAMEAARQLTTLLASIENVYWSYQSALALAEIHLLTDNGDQAIAQLSRALSPPSILSVHVLRLDPRWDPIRHHPQFQALLLQSGESEGR